MNIFVIYISSFKTLDDKLIESPIILQVNKILWRMYWKNA